MSGIYPIIFTRIDSLFKAGEGTLGFLTKMPTCTRICLALRDVKATLWKTAHGAARRFDKFLLVLLIICKNSEDMDIFTMFCYQILEKKKTCKQTLTIL